MNLSALSADDLLGIEAAAGLLVEKCRKARQKLQPVSSGVSKKTRGLSKQQETKMLARRHKSLLRKVN